MVAYPPTVGAEVAERVPVPEVIVKEIASPSATGSPWMFLTSARISLVLVPLAGRVLGVAVTVMLATAPPPPVKLTVVLAVIAPYWAVTVAVPLVVAEVNVAVARPVASVTAGLF